MWSSLVIYYGFIRKENVGMSNEINVKNIYTV